MRTDQKTIGKLLQGQTQYLVPLFQRPYVWKTANVQRLWQDVVAVSEDPDARHFLGSVVLTPSPVPSAMDRWIVVDGQQRLTTLSILFCALRDHARPTDAHFAEKIDDLYLVNRYYDGEGRSKLLPSAADQPSWSKLLRCTPDAAGADLFGSAYRFFRSALLDEDDGLDVALIERAVANQLDIVEITAGRDDNVHRIFESLNARGEPLRQADLLRNYVFMRLPTRWQAVNDQHWEPIERLAQGRLEQLVRLNLVLAGQTSVAHGDVYQTLQARLQGLDGEAAVEAWVIELHRQARTFRRIADPATEPSEPVRRALRRLKQWGSDAVHAIGVHILGSSESGLLSAVDAAAALQVVESYLVRRYLLDIPSKDNGRILGGLVRELESQPPTADALTRLLSRSNREFPTDDQVREFVKGEPFYPGVRAPKVFILLCLEESYEHRERIDLASAKLTIEHVLPRNPSKPWWDALEREASTEESAEDIHSALVHTLGNLTLTAYNPELANSPFDVKRRILADSGLSMNREIAKNKRWGKAEILARGAALAERVVTVWSGPVPAGPARAPSPRSAPAARAAPAVLGVAPAPEAAPGAAPAVGPAAAQLVTPAVAPAAAQAVTPAVAPAVGPAPRRRTPVSRQAKRLAKILAAIPAGRWTSFTEVAQVLGCHQTQVGSMILERDFPNAHRVLKKRGATAERFRWPDPARTDTQLAVLKAEGVTFDQYDRAVPELCMHADELARAIEMSDSDWSESPSTAAEVGAT
jgi:alkylated DNA nucleotide flippase Atl1